jgi:hypothetical protein
MSGQNTVPAHLVAARQRVRARHQTSKCIPGSVGDQTSDSFASTADRPHKLGAPSIRSILRDLADSVEFASDDDRVTLERVSTC